MVIAGDGALAAQHADATTRTARTLARSAAIDASACQALFSPRRDDRGTAMAPAGMLCWSLLCTRLRARPQCVPRDAECLDRRESRFVVGIAEAGLVTGDLRALKLAVALLRRRSPEMVRVSERRVAEAWLPMRSLLLLTGRLGDFDWRAPFAAYARRVSVMLVLAVVLLKQEVVAPADRGRRRPFLPACRGRLDASSRSRSPARSAFYTWLPSSSDFLRRLGQRRLRRPWRYGDRYCDCGGTRRPHPPGQALVVSRKLTHWPVGRVLALSMLAMGIGLIVMAMSGTFASMTGGTMRGRRAAASC